MNDQKEDESEGACTAPLAAAILTTQRLILRAPRMEDVPEIVPLANNRKIAEQTRRIPHPFGESDARQWIEVMDSSDTDHAYLVTDKETGRVLGAAGFGAMTEEDKEVGYWIGEPYWGKGYATEALRAVLDHLFANQPLERIYGRCRVVNAASRKVLMKCGFQLIGSGMCDCRVLKGLVPVEEFVLERSIWDSLRQWGAA